MAHKALICGLMAGTLALSLISPASAATSDETALAANYLREQGIMVGDSNGKMNLESGLTRAQLAVVLARLNGASELVQAEKPYYTSQCQFPDVPEWAKLYVGYCYTNGLMVGYDTGEFGANDGVTPSAACTVVLCYADFPDTEWNYSTACQTALSAGLTTTEATSKAEVTRGDLAVMLYRSLGSPASDSAKTEAGNEVSVGSYKGNTLSSGERSLLMIGTDAGTEFKVSSSAPSILALEQVSGNWVAVAKAPGTATVTITTVDGRQGILTITVTSSGATSEYPSVSPEDLQANMEIREEIISLVNGVRRENGVSELTVNQALMNAAQECASRRYTWHHTKEECESALAYGYPYGFGGNLTVFTGASEKSVAKTAVENWVNSLDHFQSMIDPSGDCLGVGVERYDGVTYCYLFVGMPDTHNPYE